MLSLSLRYGVIAVKIQGKPRLSCTPIESTRLDMNILGYRGTRIMPVR
jgi:hypothetical protein